LSTTFLGLSAEALRMAGASGEIAEIVDDEDGKKG
jgi:hypothetical protein